MTNVAYCRPLVKGSRGGDVVAHKRAISRWDSTVYPWQPFTPVFGPYFEQAVKTFQRRNGILSTGRVGFATHEKLERAKRKGTVEPAFDARAVELAKDFCASYGGTPEQKIRDAIIDAGFFWYANRWQIAYSQYRPFQLRKPPGVPSRWDCSGFVTNCHYAGGAPDPNGRGYDGLGYTGTLIDHGARVDTDGLEPGDLVFYGSSTGRPGFAAGDPTHVALYAGVFDGHPMVLSLGSYPMGFYRHNYRSVNHYRHYDVGPGF